MDYELFLQGPEVYIPVLLISLFITVTAYGAFPLICATARRKPVTRKKYRGLCYGINAAVMFFFIVMNGGAVSIGAYALWTGVFSSLGIKILKSRNVLIDLTNIEQQEEPERWTECKVCGYKEKDIFYECPQCGNYASPYKISQEKPAQCDQILFCRSCGEKLIENSRFCRKCGTKNE